MGSHLAGSVPQGSFLGTVLFNVFISDLMQKLNAPLAILLMVLKWGDAVGSLEGQDALERGL